nr:TlyA family RNA methyltransferase [Sansalvadorimonas sp. 2012CJ34-2]
MAETRTRAQRLIDRGRVEFTKAGQWRVLDKSGLKCPEETEFRVQADEADNYVSRGALKLLGALEKTGLDISGFNVLDVGQSTGGFTDCALQAGAKKVVGVEVGHDQLAQRLRDDDRVICLEGVNAREMPGEQLLDHIDSDGFDAAVMDVSFISQTKILPSLAPMLRKNGCLLSLVKPQFEVGKKGLGKGGIVRDESLYPEVENLIRKSADEVGLSVEYYFDSPIKGGDGNREFFICCRKL